MSLNSVVLNILTKVPRSLLFHRMRQTQNEAKHIVPQPAIKKILKKKN